MGRINLLHVSDLHVAKNPNLPPISEVSFTKKIKRIWNHETLASYDPGILRSLTKFVKKNQNELHAVVVTGDISTSGLNHDLERALKVITKFNSYAPTYLLPGNHDRYQSVLKGTELIFRPGGRKFNGYFGNYWSDDIRENEPLENGDLAVCVISADFSLRKARDSEILTPGGFYAQGLVYPSTLDKLKKATDNAFSKFNKEMQVAVVWALHFPPFAFGIEPYSELVGAEKLIETAIEKNVLAVISGHAHYKIKESKDGVFFLGTGSATQVDGKGNHIQLLSINNDNGILSISEEDFIYNHRQSRFIKYGQRF